ncbi:hypothetical protein EVAR_47953_1 [Eumeta japonica]|uniref:Uncharacterized protein n=1 Tax=Eumeta variegata TaxID=151549 RepID=A0A4C1XAI4_EUMVA|nr:hypothetical protein EVAR_47953_1 [Eumeta japonica]
MTLHGCDSKNQSLEHKRKENESPNDNAGVNRHPRKEREKEWVEKGGSANGLAALGERVHSSERLASNRDSMQREDQALQGGVCWAGWLRAPSEAATDWIGRAQSNHKTPWCQLKMLAPLCGEAKNQFFQYSFFVLDLRSNSKAEFPTTWRRLLF